MYQLINLLIAPYTLVLLALLVVLAWARYKQRQRPLSIALALVVVLSALSLPLTRYVINGSLEWPYPPSAAVPDRTDTIVVLAGNVHRGNDASAPLQLGNTTTERCLHALELYRRAGGCRVVVAGGPIDAARPKLTAAAAMQDFLIRLGMEPADLLSEDRSTTTFENAVNATRLLGERPAGRIYLVTSAWHMRRAERCFQRQGLSVIPAPCSHVALRLDGPLTCWIPSASALSSVERAVHEWLGLAWYRLRGRI